MDKTVTKNWEKSEFDKTIGIKQSQLDYIRSIKKKKSLSGQLDYIIEFFKKNYK